MSEEERTAALRANISAYDNVDEREYKNGAPHLKHESIGRIYRSLVASALDHVGQDSKTVEVLELGAGSGLASDPWFKPGVRLTAVDSSEPMLRDLVKRAAAFDVEPRPVVADALDYLESTDETFDIVTHVSMIHHVPDYLHLLARSAAHVRAGGCLLTFQDPLRYDKVAFHHHLIDRASYFAWRVGQGNVKRGLKTRWRRLRGVYSANEVVDFEDYHVVRDGVDSAAIINLLKDSFTQVEAISYWSTYSRILQSFGEHLRLVSSFGILASGRKLT
jgi:2-polyprenyl-3-methyl-5-hydroxy-6-metoxy-1,4-benzoquinol methylase